VRVVRGDGERLWTVPSFVLTDCCGNTSRWPSGTFSATGPTMRPTSASNTSMHRTRWYRSIRHARRGCPIDITDPESPGRVEQRLRDAGTYVDFTWALVLNRLHGTGHGCWSDPGQLRAAGRQTAVPAAGTLRRHLRSRRVVRHRQARRGGRFTAAQAPGCAAD
jgi:hypothetical protein